MATFTGTHYRSQINNMSLQVSPFREKNNFVYLSCYQYKKESVPLSGSFGETGLRYTLENATIETVQGVHPHLSSQDQNIYSSKASAVKPIASSGFGDYSSEITATDSNGSATLNVNPIQFISRGLKHLRVTVGSKSASSTGKIRLKSSPTDYVEYAYTTSATTYNESNRSFISVKVDTHEGGTETGTPDRDAINQIQLVVDTSGDSHFFYNWEAVEVPIQFTDSVIVINLSQCVTTDGNELSLELEKKELACGNSVKSVKASKMGITYNIKGSVQNLFAEAVSMGQLLKIGKEPDIIEMQPVILDSSGNYDLSNDISDESELVKQVSYQSANIPITTGLEAGSNANFVLNPATLVLSCGAGMAGRTIILKKVIEVSVPIYEYRTELGYTGELFIKIGFDNGGFRNRRFPKALYEPVKTVYGGENGDNNEHMLTVLETQSESTGRPTYGTNYKV